MKREFSPFSAELLRMMISEERQKFLAALGDGASWRELNRIRKNISRLNNLLDSSSRDPQHPGSPGKNEVQYDPPSRSPESGSGPREN